MPVRWPAFRCALKHVIARRGINPVVVQHKPVILSHGVAVANGSPCDPLAIVRPDEIESTLHHLQCLAGARVQYPIDTVCMSATHRSKALVVNPFQSLKLDRDVTIGKHVPNYFSLNVGL